MSTVYRVYGEDKSGVFSVNVLATSAEAAFRAVGETRPECKLNGPPLRAVDVDLIAGSEPTITYHGSGTDLATDLRAVVPLEKLRDMVDSLISSGHVPSKASSAMERQEKRLEVMLQAAHRQNDVLDRIAAALEQGVAPKLLEPAITYPLPTGENANFMDAAPNQNAGRDLTEAAMRQVEQAHLNVARSRVGDTANSERCPAWTSPMMLEASPPHWVSGEGVKVCVDDGGLQCVLWRGHGGQHRTIVRAGCEQAERRAVESLQGAASPAQSTEHADLRERLAKALLERATTATVPEVTVRYVSAYVALIGAR